VNRRESVRALVGLGAAALSPKIGAQKQPPLLGIVQFNSAPDVPAIGVYLAALRESGFVEGKNLRIERRYADYDADRYAALLEDLARIRPQVVLAPGHDIAKVAKQVIPSVNVVTWGSEDPVLSGLVNSLARPGGRITGVTFMSPQAAPKRLEILKDALPGLTRVAAVWDPTHADTYYEHMESIASALRLNMSLIAVRRPEDLESISVLAAKAAAQAVFVVPSRLTNAPIYVRRIVQLSLQAKLPTMSAYSSFADAGGLFAYGADIPDLLRRIAAQTARILSGTNPADLPMEQASRFVFVVNRKTANAIGLKLPDIIMVRADRVID
jgi:putative ABC transport system substrate-binding protein